MTDTSTNTPTGKSLDDIAAMMAAARTQMRPDEDQDQDDARGRPANTEDPVSEEEPEEISADATEDADPDPQEEDDGLAADDEDGEDSSQDEEAGELQDFTIEDDDLIEVADGVEVSFKELKDIYHADETITTQVEAAKADRLEASTARSTAINDAEKMQAAMRTLVEGLQETLSVPFIDPPDPSLKTTAPERYIAHLEAYNKDQERIKGTQESVLDLLNKHHEATEETFNKHKAHEMALLATKLPGLRDDKTKGAVSKDILDSAARYGFTEDDLKRASDHRLFEMAYHAQQYHKLTENASTEKTEEKEEAVRRRISTGPKTLRSGGTSHKQRINSSQKRIRAAKKAAEATGKPQDVASFMSARRNQPT